MAHIGVDMLGYIRDAIGECRMPRRIGVAFSGGVDSCLMASMCNEEHEVVLLTVGFAKSHDVETASETAKMFGLSHHTLIIGHEQLAQAALRVRHTLRSGTASWYENCMAFYFISALAASKGLRTVVTANGIDELFCGYDAYRRIYNRGPESIYSMIHDKTINEIALMEPAGRMATSNNVRMVQPLLHQKFIEFSWRVPLHEKVRGPDDYARKHAIRTAASTAGLPYHVCQRPKKAMQYGTRIHHNAIKFGLLP